ncbi:hypothetical protein SDRG_09797 [Saprolegnia diclina VS20]|uniref:Uncharacterized protein n=1 Tax=Saprolegnia diclina (strain VS20) TaxID=1156394 RepID=T0QFX3_SAPDV|nr:hypothetical protein SDRG_09797 [Saprolegnia diclina VS20]EQC32470.1 hypothetical protein SDRG_09797 [Saprolegnia diclina VS20]|eukprot:XP_008613971.1 hypothetical protein SDRG_09797 [Saprolegnia diclina VS20]
MALTLGLLPLLEAAPVAKIVCVSSALHQLAPTMGIDFDHINDEAVYGMHAAYGQSKLAMILFARELHKRLRARGVNHVYVTSLHPGVVQTEIARELPWIVQKALWLFQRNADDGAKTQLYCATSPEIEKKDLSGLYFTAIAKLKETTTLGQDMDLAAKLWTFTEELIASKTPSN